MVVVCDDARTAPAYFNLLKREVKRELTLDVEPKRSDRGGPKTVIALAIRKWEQLRPGRPDDMNDHDDNDRQTVWALIDREHSEEQRQAADDAKRIGEKRGVRVALSNPCFEVWTLLHLIDTGGAFADCSAVIDRIEHEWRTEFKQEFGKKAQADYSKIIDRRFEAARRARQHHDKATPDPSWTEVYRVIEEIERLANPSGP